ncbi:MAG: glycosyltransferase [Ignavibacteria bacterium]|nr:glycosyltransferase [Ignavibacteria bacterium]
MDEIFYNPNKKLEIKDTMKIVFYNGVSADIERGLMKVIEILNVVSHSVKIELFILGQSANIPTASKNLIIIQEFLKSKEQLIEFLKDKHFCIKSNVFDSFSIFAAECMASGLILVISDNVGLSHFIKNGENGFIYNKNNSTEAIHILSDIVKGKYNLNQISKNASEIVKILNWKLISEQYLEEYSR